MFLLVLQSHFKLFIYLNYFINFKQITNEFCINKSFPEKQCKGRCYLSRQLKKQDIKEKKLPLSIIEIKEIQLFISYYNYIPFNFIKCLTSTPLSVYIIKEYRSVSVKIFQPPQ